MLRGFEESDIVPFGGLLEPMRLDADVTVPLTFVPPFPTFPPETAWMRQPKTDVPALALRMAAESRVTPPVAVGPSSFAKKAISPPRLRAPRPSSFMVGCAILNMVLFAWFARPWPRNPMTRC